MPILDIHQLMVLRSLLKVGSPVDLASIFLSRCGCSEAGWAALTEAGLVEQKKGRWLLTEEGKKQYRKQKVGKWF